MSTSRVPSRNAAVAIQTANATPQDKRPATAKIAPESAFGAAVKNREALGAEGMLALQAAAGNRAVAGLVQAKRERSSTDDSARVHEAARPRRAPVQRQPAARDPVQRKSAASPGAQPGATTAVERFAHAYGTPDLDRRLPHATTGQPLEPSLRGHMESAFATDFGDVRIHHDGQAEAIGARAFTRGAGIHVAPGAYDPGSQGGRELLGHELSHVVQQRAGRVGAPQGERASINLDGALEAEADRAGAVAARGGPAGLTGGARPLDAARSPIQGLFGFEIELGVLLSERIKTEVEDDALESGFGLFEVVSEENENENANDAEGTHGEGHAHGESGVHADHAAPVPTPPPDPWTYREPAISKDSDILSNTAFALRKDHQARVRGASGKWGFQSILEIVTHPVDEAGLTENALRVHMQTATSFAESIPAATNALTDSCPLKNVMGGAPDNYYIGSLVPGDAKSQTVNGSLQANFGVRPSGTARMVGETNQNKQRGGVVSAADVSPVIELLGKRGFSPLSADLVGLLRQLTLYLIAGKTDRSGTTSGSTEKNAVGTYLVKGDHAQLLHKVAPELVAALTKDALLRRDVIKELFTVTERGDGPLFVGTKWGISASEWLEEILTGTQDKVASLLNRPGLSRFFPVQEVGADPNRRAPGLVIENRQFGRSIPPGEWPDRAVALWRQLAEANKEPT